MAANNIESYYYSGQGVVLMGEIDENGQALSLLPIGNVSALTIAIETSRTEHKESQTGARGTDKVITTEVGAAVNITIEHLIQANLALGLYGESKDVAAATAKEFKVPKVKLGTVTPLPAIKLSNVTVDDGADTPAVTYTEGENYRVNMEAGSIYWFTAAEQTAAGATETLADDAAVAINYDSAAHKQLDALTSSAAPTRFLRFEGLNTVENNDPVVIDIFKFESSPLAEYALINEEISNIALEGNALADTSRTTGSKYFTQRSLK
ncbi:major tail protein [Vibrio phage V-YDF132]|nr:major tail protein [Vibrio phage V-YDF132]